MPNTTLYMVIINLASLFKPMDVTGHCVVSAFQVCLEDMMSILKQMSNSVKDVPVCVVRSECDTVMVFKRTEIQNKKAV